MKDKIFIDTNIFVYAFLDNSKNKKEHKKHLEAKKLLESFDSSYKIIISTQVCSEYYSALLKNKISDIEIQHSLKELIKAVDVNSISKSTILTSMNIKNQYKYSYWDCLIIATAIENNCNILYSEDMQHNQIVDNQLKIINPFI
jgi:predicted nucleic acid-binding protein